VTAPQQQGGVNGELEFGSRDLPCPEPLILSPRSHFTNLLKHRTPPSIPHEFIISNGLSRYPSDSGDMAPSDPLCGHWNDIVPQVFHRTFPVEPLLTAVSSVDLSNIGYLVYLTALTADSPENAIWNPPIEDLPIVFFDAVGRRRPVVLDFPCSFTSCNLDHVVGWISGESGCCWTLDYKVCFL
jgi:hypothetical protein